MARSTKLTPELQNQICAFIASGATFADACRLAGVSESSYYSWLKRYPEFSEAIKKAMTQFKRTHLAKISADKSWQSSAWILERRYPDEFGRRPVEVTGKDGGPMMHDEVVHFYLPDNGR